MKFASAAILLIAAGTASAFAPNPSLSTRFSSSPLRMSEKTSEEKKISKRLRFMKSDQFFRNGFKEVRKDVEATMEGQFKSELVDTLKANEYVIERDGVKVHLADSFGFCWGVERSIALAYEAVKHFPDRKVHITNELIHNPEVNDNLHNMNVNFIEKSNSASGKDFSVVNDNDVVILPAFGASFEEMQMFNDKDVEVVDTTCPWVSKVWNTVDKHQKKGLTSIIHGKYEHEETVATVSFCEDYICVKNMDEAKMVVEYIKTGEGKEAFMEYFKNAVSEGFDPDTMLVNLGLANQTTMYKTETRAIGQMLQVTMMEKYGPVDIKSHYLEFDTICDATQVRTLG
jgi:4-hydroxy-3-methylbut-2-enyl diphosphate reductase